MFQKIWRKENFDAPMPIVIAVYFLVITLIIRPFGNFPLNDDWVHTLTIYTWITEGRFWYPLWLAPTVHIPILYGAALTKLFGFSFVILRMSTLVFAWASCWVLYIFLRKSGYSENRSFFGMLLLAVNPLFIHLSFTFMSDIPALFFLLLSALFYKKGFEKKSTRYLFAGSLAAIFGFYTRQFVILIACAAGIVFFLKMIREKKVSEHLKSFCLAFLLPSLLCVSLYYVLAFFHFVPGKMGARFIPSQWSFIHMVLTQTWYAILYLALCIAPLSVAVLIKNTSFFKNRVFIPLCAVMCVGVFFVMTHRLVFPFFGNIFSWYGIGPSAGEVLQGSLSHWGGKEIYLLINGLGGVSLIACVLMIGQRYIFGEKKIGMINFIPLFGILYFFLLVSLRSFDRYLLFLLPCCIMLFLHVSKNISWSRMMYGSGIFFLCAYGVIGTYNYFRWNEARWSLGKSLVEKGVSPLDIEGGYEWVGWYAYPKKGSSLSERQNRMWYVKELAPWHSMYFVISFSPLKGYTVIEEKKVQGFFSHIHSLYLLTRNQ